MVFKTGSGKETLFSEHPSCAKPKHFFHTNLLHLTITWADSASRELHQVYTGYYELNFHRKPYGYRASDVSWLWEGRCIHTVQLRTRCRSVRACPDSSAAAAAPAQAWNGAPADGCARLVPEQLPASISTARPRCGLLSSYTLQRQLHTGSWM